MHFDELVQILLSWGLFMDFLFSSHCDNRWKTHKLFPERFFELQIVFNGRSQIHTCTGPGFVYLQTTLINRWSYLFAENPLRDSFLSQNGKHTNWRCHWSVSLILRWFRFFIILLLAVLWWVYKRTFSVWDFHHNQKSHNNTNERIENVCILLTNKWSQLVLFRRSFVESRKKL